MSVVDTLFVFVSLLFAISGLLDKNIASLLFAIYLVLLSLVK